MEYRRTREPLLARRLLLDKVRAGQEKAALEEAAAARDAGAGGAGGSAADAICRVTVICNGYTRTESYYDTFDHDHIYLIHV